MSNINKYFNNISKKRDLSGDSNPEEEKKKLEKEALQQARTLLQIMHSRR